MSEKKDTEKPTVYQSHPPAWLPTFHASADLGFPGFHPPRPGRDEDVLTENNVKLGYILSQSVSVETFSAQAMINEKLHSNETLSKLEELMNEVFIRRVDAIPTISPSTFRIPTRVTLNDAKRNAWFADLANPDVPLHKLGKSVPHAAKGQDLLDLLHTNKVAIPRAVWFLRVFGVNETAGLRNKPNYIPTQYSIDWANVVTVYMRKQLGEINLPSAPRPGVAVKHTFRGIFAETETRDRWMSRFSYCLKLLRSFYAESLVDHRTFLTWLVQQMMTCNLAQAAFLTRLIDEYLDDILSSRAIARSLVEACAAKLSEISTTPAQNVLQDTTALLREIIQRICFAIPDALVGPKMWIAYSPLLEDILTKPTMRISNDRCIEQSIRDLHHLLSEKYTDVRQRNEAMLFRNPVLPVSARLGTAVGDVKLLNAISAATNLNDVEYFNNDVSDLSGFKEKLDMLLAWSVTPMQYGEHRPFAAATLIRIWRDRACDRASRRDVETPSEYLQDQLFDWLDKSEIAGEVENVRSVALLYGKLVKYEIFSYARYVQRLIARGEPGLGQNDPTASRHRLFLSSVPLFNATSSVSSQRKVILYGIRARETPEDITERDIRKEIRSILPDVFQGNTSIPVTLSMADLCAQVKTLLESTRYIQVRTFRQWLLPVFKKHITRPDVSCDGLLRSYLIAVEVMAHCKCYHSILDLTLCMLEHCTDTNAMNGLVGTFYRYGVIWACMDEVPTIVNALDAAHQTWKQRGVQSRPLLTLITQLDNDRYLTPASRERNAADVAAFALALQPVVDRPENVPEALTEILLLAGETDPTAPSMLANGLWLKYRTSPLWAWRVWDNTIASLRQIPNMMSDSDAMRICALKYGTFLWHVDQHLPHGLDNDVLQWFMGPGKAEIAALNSNVWIVLQEMLLYLVISGALKATTILQGLIYPAWQLGANNSLEQVFVSDTYLSSANSLCHRLLLQDDSTENALPSNDMFEVQSIRTRIQDVFEEPHFAMLVLSIPALISLEHNSVIPQALRHESNALRCRLCQQISFRQAAYRNLDIVRDAFENSPHLMTGLTGADESSKRALAGLRMILGDSADDTNVYDWPEVTCLLSPWKIAATNIQMQLQIKQLGRALYQESTAKGATAALNKLTAMLLNHTQTSEEAFYVGEMVKGADVQVATKFINTGFQCIVELINANNGVPPRVGELLRVLVHVSHPLREFNGGPLPTLDAAVQESFLCAVDKLERVLESQIIDEAQRSEQSKHDSILLLRLLQFMLSFRTTWTAKSKDYAHQLANSLFRFCLHCAIEPELNVTVYPIVFDTLLAIYDEIPHDSKTTTFDPYRYYPNISPNAIAADIPPEYQKQLRALLVQLPVKSAVTNLVNAHRDSEGNVVYGPSVVNKPWEWTENLGEPSNPEGKEDEKQKNVRERFNARYVVKNSGSISLDNFGAKLTGDSVQDLDWEDEGWKRSFEDGLTESIFIRDWRETRVQREPEIEPDVLSIEGDGDAGHDGGVVRPMRSVSSSSTISRSSAGTATSRQQRPSPAHTRTSMQEFIDVDSISTTTTSSSVKARDASKRKASVAEMSDDEVEIVEGPVTITSGAGKRQKGGKAPPKARKRK
ncbi:hypothetical protein CVT24_004119 [Panaeolus cyanescens]|uniref:Mediator of RNA polymerase II transcription subunit 12 n=1 Tax=Panaeolus cyanescens TaxID=181874 RepID=A0A409Y603_9AGAR|nr:hypothetical protein CVT24_004119 [Panaeolus cyanescens]